MEMESIELGVTPVALDLFNTEVELFPFKDKMKLRLGSYHDWSDFPERSAREASTTLFIRPIFSVAIEKGVRILVINGRYSFQISY